MWWVICCKVWDMFNRTETENGLWKIIHNVLKIENISHIVNLIDYIVYRSLTCRLWSLMLQFLHDTIKLYNVRERRVHFIWGKSYKFCTERLLYFVNVLRLSCTTRCLGALRRLVVTTLYVLYSLVNLLILLCVVSLQVEYNPASNLYKHNHNNKKTIISVFSKSGNSVPFTPFQPTWSNLFTYLKR